MQDIRRRKIGKSRKSKKQEFRKVGIQKKQEIEEKKVGNQNKSEIRKSKKLKKIGN